MPQLPASVVLALGPDVDARQLAKFVSAPVTPGPARATDRVLMDTFDGRLRRRGLYLWRQRSRAGRGGPPTVQLTLEESRQGPLTATVEPPRPDRILVGDLPPGALSDRVGPVLGERALLPQVRVRSRSEALGVCNADGKTVVRLTVEDPTVVTAGQTVPLGRRLVVAPVLGYDRDFEQVSARLKGRGRLSDCAGPVVSEALEAAGLPIGGVSSDVDVHLEPAMRADRAMMAISRRLADVVDANLAGTVADLDPEFLHDLRVAVRRSRAVLKEMKGVLDPEAAARARSDLRWVQEVTGPTRDLDVLLHDWPAMAAPVPAAMAGDLQPLRRLLQQHREDAFAAMRRNLRSRRFALAWGGWRALVDDGPEQPGPNAGAPIGRLAGGRIVSVYRGMVQMGTAIDDGSPPEALHDLRKRGKELRYLLELFGGMWPAERVKPLVSALKGLQDVLGHFQDDEVQVKELRSLGPALAATEGGTDSLIALGFVIDGLSISQRQARADFAARFADFAAPDNRRIVTDTFAPHKAAAANPKKVKGAPAAQSGGRRGGRAGGGRR